MRRLATRLGRTLRALERRIGFRGSALLLFALWCGGSAVRLARADEQLASTPTLAYLATIAPLPILAIPWAVATLLCLVCAFREEDKVAFAATAGVMIFWAFAYLVGGVQGVIPQGAWAFIVQMVLAGFVLRLSRWPEPPRGR